MGRTRQDSRRSAELVAVVDLGSTAVRFLLASITPGVGYRVLVEERVPTRLGGGAPGTLPRDAIDETLRAVHRFFRRYSSSAWGPRVIAVATSAVRDARNRERLLGPLRGKEGIDVQVLSARDEARFGAYAALESLPFEDGVVADLGGASLQLSRVRDRKIVSVASLPLGAVRTTGRFLRQNRPRSRELQAFRTEIRGQILGALPPARRGEVLVGLGGSVRTLASIHLRVHRGERKHRHGLRLQQSDVTAIRERLEALSQRKRKKIRGLKAERADIILAGAMVIEEAMVFGGYLTLVVCTRGVRDGILLHETFNRRG
jgi:exopolyphosphatase / guanosine-5'-triphosphate,3'-diphosphate pyrophosphatase